MKGLQAQGSVPLSALREDAPDLFGIDDTVDRKLVGTHAQGQLACNRIFPYFIESPDHNLLECPVYFLFIPGQRLDVWSIQNMKRRHRRQ